MTGAETPLRVELVQLGLDRVAAGRRRPPMVGADWDGPPPAFTLGLHALGQPEFGLSFRVEVQLPVGEISVCVRADYRADGSENLTESRVIRFAREHALEAMLPVMRQEVATLAASVLGVPLFMPVMAPDSFQFDRMSEAD